MRVVSVNVGEPRELSGADGHRSGIYKEPVAALTVGPLGAEGDHVLDTRHHGGPSKALCCYSQERLAYWREQYPDGDWEPGAFGENLTFQGLHEDNVNVGDVFRIDQVVAQVSQPRGPCATLARRHGLPEFVRICVQAGHTGWYLRILRCGTIRAGQAVSRVSSHLDGVSIAEANRLRYADPPDRRGLERLLAIDALSDEWRKDVAKLLTRT